MYERVAALGQKRSLGQLFARRPAWATALAVTVVLVLALTVVQFVPFVVPGGGQQVAQLPQRAVFVAEKSRSPDTPPPGDKGERGGRSQFRQLVFQAREANSRAIRSVNVLTLYARPVVLTAEDSYRLVLEPAAVQYVYVYQQTPAGMLVQLYPNEAYSPRQNPMQAEKKVYLPGEPNGFYLEGQEGASRLYVVAARASVSELESLYAQYSQRGIWLGRRKSLATVQELLDVIVEGQMDGVSGWTFAFEVR
jgi:hypothetical protein